MSALITWLLWGAVAVWLAYSLVRDMRRNHRVTHRVERHSSGGER